MFISVNNSFLSCSKREEGISKFVTIDAYLRTQYKQIIYLIRQLKQATLNHTRDEDAHSTPSNRLYVTNIHIRVPGEEQITPDSKMRLSFHAHLLHDIDDNMFLDDLDLSDSDSEDDDLNILLQRKKRKNAGDKSPLPPAHLPYYPEVSHPISQLTIVY